MTLKNKFFIQISYKKYTIEYVIRCNYLKNEKEFLKLDERTKGILIAEISRITGMFVLNYDINKVFCPRKEEINFKRI